MVSNFNQIKRACRERELHLLYRMLSWLDGWSVSPTVAQSTHSINVEWGRHDGRLASGQHSKTETKWDIERKVRCPNDFGTIQSFSLFFVAFALWH